MPREIGIGLLGVGWMGRLHSTSYLRVPAHYPECAGTARLAVAADLGSHAVDLAHFLLGPVVRVSAAIRVVIPRRPKLAMGEGTHFSVAPDDAELGEVENEDWAAALVEFASGVVGTIELSRVIVGAEARYAFEVNGTAGAVSWNFERLNELEVAGASGTTRVLMGPGDPE